MKKLFLRPLVQRGLTLCLLPAILIVYSMVVFAVSGKSAGELVLKRNSNDLSQAVTVNGEPARSSRVLFASSVVSTPEDSGAVVNLGTEGRIELAPGSSFILNADGTPGGTLTSGSMKVLSAASGLGLKTSAGKSITPNVGETVTASGSVARKAQKGPGGISWWIWWLIIGGVAAGTTVAIIAANDDSEQMSPVR